MNRPTGVTVLAVLDFIGTGVCLLATIGAFVGGAIFGAALAGLAGQSGGSAAGAGAGAAIGAVFGGIFLIGAAIAAVVGFGMWNLKEWGRILQIVFAALGALGRGIGLLASLAHFRLGSMMMNIIFLAINAWIIYYLVQPQIKAAFAPKPMQAAAGR